MQSHNLEHKSPKQKRAFSKNRPVAGADERVAKRQLGRR
jgi:ribosomal protein L35